MPCKFPFRGGDDTSWFVCKGKDHWLVKCQANHPYLCDDDDEQAIPTLRCHHQLFMSIRFFFMAPTKKHKKRQPDLASEMHSTTQIDKSMNGLYTSR